MNPKSDARRSRLGRAGVSGAAVTLGALAAGGPADAATFNVTNLNDTGAGSLRQAILDANTAVGADVITFQTGLTGTIALTLGQLHITDSVEIQGPGAAALTVTGNHAYRVFYVDSSAATIDVTISGLTVTGGFAATGAGINVNDANLTLNRVTVTGNTATGDGAGLWADGPNMSLTILDSTISGNTAGDDGGGIYIGDIGRRLSIAGTTVSGNEAQAGGGIFIHDSPHDGALANSTISGNQAIAGHGGGLYVGSAFYCGLCDTVFRVSHLTVAGNSASGMGGGIFVGLSYLDLNNSIVGDNTAGTNNDVGSGTHGGFTAHFDLIESPGNANFVFSGSNIFNQDPQLGPLQDNGGPTRTHLPAITSPAVDAGSSSFTVDQRGQPRPFGAAVDIGAVELSAGVVEVPTLGDVGKILLGGLVGLAGFLLLRRR